MVAWSRLKCAASGYFGARIIGRNVDHQVAVVHAAVQTRIRRLGAPVTVHTP